MTIELNLVDFLIILISTPLIFFSGYIAYRLLTKKDGRKITNVLLGTLLIVGGLIVLDHLIVYTGIAQKYNVLYMLPFSYSLSIGPIIFFYFKLKLQPGYTWKRMDWIHFILPGVQILINLVIGFRSVEFKTHLWNETAFPSYLLAVRILFPFITILYFILARKILYSYKPEGSILDVRMKKWMLLFLRIVFILLLCESLFIIFDLLQIYFTGRLIIEFFLELGLLLWFVIKAYDQNFPHRIVGNNGPKKDSYVDTENDVFNQEKGELIVRVMEEEQIYRNPDLNLEILSRYIGLSKPQTSKLISSTFNKNFNDFLNGYRLHDVIRAFDEGRYEQLTLIALAYEAGFSSKSTFYRYFKNEIGSTPTEYIHKHKHRNK